MSWRSVALLWIVTCYGSLAECFSLETAAHSSSTPKPQQNDAAALLPVSTATFWEHVEEGPPDIILGIAAAFRACVRS